MSGARKFIGNWWIITLNMIELTFLPRWWKPRNGKVIEAWRALFGELYNVPPPNDAYANMLWGQRCDDRLVDLLLAMSRALGYRFTAEELRRGIYYPKGKFDVEQAQLGVLHGVRSVLEGNTALQMRVVEFPNDPVVLAAQATLLQNMGKSYTDKGELKVRIAGGGKEESS